MNTNTSNLFLNVLDRERFAVFTSLAQVSHGWYLVGGTALALQIGHRISFDFDFFSQQEIDTSLRQKVIKLFGDELHFTMDTKDQITFITSTQVKVTFASTLYAPLYSLISSPSVQMESVDDIAADKAFTIGRRGAFRDYVDLFFILSRSTTFSSLSKIISDAHKKYGAMFDEKLFLEQLDYVQDIKDFSIELLGEPRSLETIQEFLHSKILEYLLEKRAAL